jgi:AraC-like DNA-binding protein
MMEPISQVLQDSFVYSCTFEKRRGYEQFVPNHVLAFQISGETHIEYQDGIQVLRAGQVLLTRKNQLAKSLKLPADDKEYKIISVIFSEDVLHQFAIGNNIVMGKKYCGPKSQLIKPDAFLNTYFYSLLPYVEKPGNINKKLAILKTTEAIELLLQMDARLSDFLFDFSEPHKIDLEKFMQENFRYNVPVANFATLSGRSLAAFKRDFVNIFHVSPRKWLQDKRLKEAHYLIEQKQKRPADIYLDLGFENLSHFYRSFKQKYGVTPAEL